MMNACCAASELSVANSQVVLCPRSNAVDLTMKTLALLERDVPPKAAHTGHASLTQCCQTVLAPHLCS